MLIYALFSDKDFALCCHSDDVEHNSELFALSIPDSYHLELQCITSTKQWLLCLVQAFFLLSVFAFHMKDVNIDSFPNNVKEIYVPWLGKWGRDTCHRMAICTQHACRFSLLLLASIE